MQLPSPVKPPSETNEPVILLGYGATLLRAARRVTVFILGLSVLLVGIVMIVGPGPAVVVIPVGLGILATELLWARRILDSMKRRLPPARPVARHTGVSLDPHFCRKNGD